MNPKIAEGVTKLMAGGHPVEALALGVVGILGMAVKAISGK